jgi:hypothetical protein
MSAHFDSWHMSRGWPGHTHVEDACPCPQEPCGMVAYGRIDPHCQEHPPERGKTIRDSHPASLCPALTKP